MSASDQSDIPTTQTQTPVGHDIMFFVPVRTLISRHGEPLNLTYTVNCHNLRTSWILSIAYAHRPDTGRLQSMITLKRTDRGDRSMNAFIIVSEMDGSETFVQLPRLLGSGQLYPGGKIHASVDEFKHPGFRCYMARLRLTLRISLFIRNCHFGTKFDDEPLWGTSSKKRRHSKI